MLQEILEFFSSCFFLFFSTSDFLNRPDQTDQIDSLPFVHWSNELKLHGTTILFLLLGNNS